METALGAAHWVLGKVLNKLSDDLVAAYVSSKELGLNFNKMKTDMNFTLGLLHEAQQRDVTNPGLQGLLEYLSKKADEAENALDELHYFMIQDQLDGTQEAVPDLGDVLSNDVWHLRHAARHAAGNWLSYLTCCRKQDDPEKLTFDRVSMSKNIKSLIEEMHSLCEPIIKLLQVSPSSNNPQKVICTTLKRPPTSSLITQDKLYGRDAIFSQTIDYMTSEMHNETLSVLPIVGPGGIGKTTFTQHLFNHVEIKQRFSVRVWICVSANFDVVKLTQEILSCIPASEKEDSNQANSTSNLNLLHESIAKRLKSKSFLIVFDDIWECKNKSDWDILLAPFKKGETKGNMVLVTTRFPKIANMVKKDEATNTINLQGLEPDGFWKFFQDCVFGEFKDEKHKDDLIGIAKAISDKLKCSPLAAKTVGSLLRNNHSPENWIGILNKKEWENLKRSDDDIMPALRISYDYLPFHLKKCFSYCALFPEDHRFHTTELTCFWDAMGIVDTSGQTDRVQDLVDELVDNGFLIKQVEDDESESYMLHDLLHELSRIVSSQECVNISFPGFIANNIRPSIRHVSVVVQGTCFENFQEEMIKLKTMIDIENLRSLMIFESYRSEKLASTILKDTFNKIKNLRILFIFMNSPGILPHNFSNLIHLRYLKIRTPVSLPGAISRFYHLKFLYLEACDDFSDEVPKGFNRLVNLRHLYSSNEFHSNIPGVGKMECLEMLGKFHVKKESIGFELAELGRLTKLRGHLGIYDLQKVETKEEAEEANLKNKCSLRGLTLYYDRGQPTTEHDVIDGLQPHSSLRKLAIYNHSGLTGPSWLSRDIHVTSLECLSLSGISWDTLPPFGRLPLLKSLCLHDIGGLLQLRLDSGGLTDGSFKHLKTIELSNMPDLVEWIGGDNSHLFSRLEIIRCFSCPNLTMLPFYDCNGPAEVTDITWFPDLCELRITNCPKLSQLPPIPYTSTLADVTVEDSAGYRLQYARNNLLNVYGYSYALAFHNLGIIESMSMANAPHISLADLQKLYSLRELSVNGDTFSGEVGSSVVLPSVQKLKLEEFHPTERLLSNIFKCLPALSKLEMRHSNEDHGDLVLQLPFSSLLHKLKMAWCNNLVLSAEDGGALRDLTSLQSLEIYRCDKMFSQCSLPEATQIINPFPASLRKLEIQNQAGMLSMGMLSNLRSLTSLILASCKNLSMDGLSTLIKASLKSLHISGCGSVDLSSEFARIVPVDTCQLEHLVVDCIAAVLVAPVCTCLSTTLRAVVVIRHGTKRFTKHQEKALQLLRNLEELTFLSCLFLESLPEVLHCLCSLKKLSILECPQIQCLPEYGLPTSLKFLELGFCSDEFQNKVGELKQSHPNLEVYVQEWN